MKGLTLHIALLALLSACSNPAEQTKLGSHQQAIIECNGFSIGLSCDTDDDPCTQEVCVQEGQNVFCTLEQLAPNGTPCLSDDRPCTADRCQQGVCEHVPLEAGTLCDDGLFCTQADRCSVDGSCTGSATTCNDSNSCTEDSCDEESETCDARILVDQACDDDDACTEATRCDATGACTGTSVDCSDGSDCTLDRCNAITGCESVPDLQGSCNDDFFCTISEFCSEDGSCQGEANCNDGNPCTIDSCDEAGESCDNTVAADAPCDDGNACTLTDTCTDTGECVGYLEIDGTSCSAAGGCLTSGSCDEGECLGGLPLPNGQSCDDNNACTVQESCDEGTCEGSPIDCDDGDACTADGCDSTSGCFHLRLEQCLTPPDAGAGNRDAGTGIRVDGGGNYNGDAGLQSVLGGGGCSTAGQGQPGFLFAIFLFLAFLLKLRRRLSLFLLLALLPLNSVADAQGFDSEIFKPATSSTSFLSQQNTEVLPAWTLNMGLSLNVASDPLVLRDAETGVPLMDGSVVSRRTGLHLSGALGIAERYELGFSLPFVLAQSGNMSQLLEAQQLQTSSLGDLHVMGKARVWNDKGKGLTLVSAISLTFPTGEDLALIGEQEATVTPQLVLGYRAGPIQVAANIGLRIRNKTQVAGLVVDDEWKAGVGGHFEITPGKLWLIGEAYANRRLGQSTRESSPKEALVGLRQSVSGPWQIQAALGFGIGPGYGTPAMRAVFGLTYAPPTQQRSSERAPLKVSLSASTPKQQTGIASPAPTLSHPNHDGDGDGLVDVEDLCPADAEDFDQYQDSDGCPELDNDGDGIVDTLDACPLVPEVLNGIDDSDGCPDQGIIEMVNRRVILDETVLFDKNRARVKRKGRKALKAIIALYQQHPTWGPMRIEGHADNRGPENFNLWLSTRRAERVRKEMIGFGMDPTKISCVGLGETRPLDAASSSKAMDSNRRVEFVILDAQ